MHKCKMCLCPDHKINTVITYGAPQNCTEHLTYVVGKSRFTFVSTRNTEFILVFLLFVYLLLYYLFVLLLFFLLLLLFKKAIIINITCIYFLYELL
jgi:hypothetical protein